MTCKPKPISCAGCGRFIAYQEIEDGTAKYYHTPDTDFCREESYWECARCSEPKEGK